MIVTADAEIVGNIWKIVAREGDAVGAGDVIAILESMKMEIPVKSPVAGHISKFVVSEGQIVQEGDAVAEIDQTIGA